MAKVESAALRQQHIEALTRRAALHQGAVRQLLDARLRALHADAVAPPKLRGATAPRPNPPINPPINPLTALLAHIAAHGAEDGAESGEPARPGTVPAARELKAVRDYRSTWSRLSVEQRVNQALARVPNNAGPLNTQRLVHQALTVLRDASPAYMHRLVTQVEALLWLERVGQGESGSAAKKKPGAAAPATGSSRS